jgi:ABC-type glycerol-3-phosphate transport system substrate-binding protein
MNALRRLCIWSLVLCATFLAGCGSKDLPSSSSDIAGADLRIAIMSTSDQELSDCVAINNKIRQYMGNKNAKIATYKYAYPAASQRYIDEILNDLASEDAPDIIYVPSRALAQMLDDAGAIMALDKVVKDNISGFDTLLYKSATLIARGHGHIIGIPINLDPVMVAYNKNHFQKAQVEPDRNWSWSQFAETSTRIMAANNPGGYIGAGVLDRSVYSWLPFVYSNGGGYIEDYTINVQSPNTVHALDWMQTHIQNGNLTYMTSMQDALRNEKVSFGHSLISNVNSFNSINDIYRTLPVPKSPKTGQSITIVSGALFVVNAQAKNLDLIVDFLKASLNTQAQQYILYSPLTDLDNLYEAGSIMVRE